MVCTSRRVVKQFGARTGPLGLEAPGRKTRCRRADGEQGKGGGPGTRCAVNVRKFQRVALTGQAPYPAKEPGQCEAFRTVVEGAGSWRAQ